MVAFGAKFQYNLTDHLGNVRVTVEASKNTGGAQNYSRLQQNCVTNGEQTVTIISNPGAGILDLSMNVTTTFGVGSTTIAILEGDTELAAIEAVFSSGTTHTVSFDELVLSGDAAIKVRIGETGTSRTSCMQNIQSTVTTVTATAVQKGDKKNHTIPGLTRAIQ